MQRLSEKRRSQAYASAKRLLRVMEEFGFPSGDKLAPSCLALLGWMEGATAQGIGSLTDAELHRHIANWALVGCPGSCGWHPGGMTRSLEALKG